MRINKHDTQGTKPLLSKGELGYDDYQAGGDTGRVYVGTGTENIPVAKKIEVDAVDDKADTHIARVDNPHGVTKAQVGLGLVDNTADASKNVLSATKWTTARTITLSGDVAGSASIDGSANVTITTTVQPNSVTLGTDTTGNYVANVTAGTGISISGTAGEGWSPTISHNTSDGYLHVPATGTTNSGKVLTAGATAGSLSWQTIPSGVADHALLTNIGTNTHAQIDTAMTRLANVDNTSDINKPISTATQTALNLKANDNAVVKLTGNQIIAEVKTFTSSPIVPTPTTDFQAATKKYVDGKTSTGVYLGSYGLEWNETTDTYRRIGAENYTAIQSLMKRCVLNADGSVNYYLDPNNSSYKEDGTLADLTGASGNVMVEVPKTYVRYEYTTTGGAGTDTVHRWEISLTPDTGFEAHWAFDRGGAIRDKRYYPAYLGYVTGGKMISRSGV